MVRVKPFAAVRPPKEYVEEVAARPYDVLNSAEAKAEASEKSLLHITKPEIDFDPIIDEHSQAAYDKAVENFRDWQKRGWLVQDDRPYYYIYAQTMDGRTQYGLVVCALGLVLVPFLPSLISGPVPPDINLYVLYLLNLAATVFSYWLFAYKGSVLQAHQRNDVVSKVTLLTDAVKYVLQLAVLVAFRSYYLYVMAILVTQIINNILTALVAERMFPEYRARGRLNKAERRSINHRIADLFTAKVGTVIVYSSDTIVISAFLGLSALAIYQNYYYIFSAVTSMVTIVFTSVRAGLGNSIIVDSREKVFADFKKFLLIVSWIAGFCCSCFLCLYQPFMVLWVGPDLLLDFGVVICLVVYFYVHCMNVFLNSYKDAAGMWHEDRFRPLVEAVTNLALSIVLVQRIGLYGVVLSTIVSMLLVGPWLVHNLFSLILDMRFLGQFLRRLGYYVLAALVAAGVTYLACRLVNVSLVATLVVRFVLCVFLANITIWVFFRRIPEFDDCLTLVDHVSHGKLHGFVEFARRHSAPRERRKL